MRSTPFVIYLFLAITVASCAEYTPKPRGYLRLEPPTAAYQILPLDDLPYSFHISSQTVVELPPVGEPAEWINVAYPSLGAKIYCSYLSVTPQTLAQAMAESRELVVRQSQGAQTIREQAYENPEQSVFGHIYQLDGSAVSPIQFTLTDSARRFFRGSLIYDFRPNGDSIAPVTDYLRNDIVELIQTFTWKD